MERGAVGHHVARPELLGNSNGRITISLRTERHIFHDGYPAQPSRSWQRQTQGPTIGLLSKSQLTSNVPLKARADRSDDLVTLHMDHRRYLEDITAQRQSQEVAGD